jgi:hypothetical protein
MRREDMKNEILVAIIVGIAIVAAATIHAFVVRDVGRYAVSQVPNGVALRIDTVTGQLFDPDGRPWPAGGKLPKKD